jgi:hypothetical protein
MIKAEKSRLWLKECSDYWGAIRLLGQYFVIRAGLWVLATGQYEQAREDDTSIRT